MGAYGESLQAWLKMPPIWHDHVERLPRGKSYSRERDAGRALIALRWPKLWKQRVFVRNVCHGGLTKNGRSNGHVAKLIAAGGEAARPIIVENMREFDGAWSRLRIAEGAKTGTYAPATKARTIAHCYLDKLKERGWEVVAGPFLIEDPMHNCMLDLREKEWAELWRTHRTEAWGVRNLGDQTSSRFLDTEESAFAAEIRLHYRGLGVTEGWTPKRVNALAERWSMSIRELQHYVCCEAVIIERFMAGMLTTLPGPICLWFFFMERLATQREGKRVKGAPLFPVRSTEAAAA